MKTSRELLSLVTEAAQSADRELIEEEATTLDADDGEDEHRLQSLRARSVALWQAQDALLTASRAERQITALGQDRN